MWLGEAYSRGPVTCVCTATGLHALETSRDVQRTSTLLYPQSACGWKGLLLGRHLASETKLRHPNSAVLQVC